MTTVITGATGCLGMSLTQRLLQEGHEVIALGRNLEHGAKLEQFGATFIACDITSQEPLKTICQPAKLIFHCAALSSTWGKKNDFYQANVIGTQHVIEATPSGAKLIYVSTPSIYFDFTEKHQIKENSILPRHMVNDYATTKFLAEKLIDHAWQEKNLPVITLRPRGIFGPYDKSIFPKILSLEKNGTLPIIGSGQQVVDITYVDNVVEALILASQASTDCYGKKYNITNDEPMTFLNIIAMLYRLMDKPLECKHYSYKTALHTARLIEIAYRFFHLKRAPKLTKYSVGVCALGQTLNIDAAKNELGYRPICAIEKGLQHFIDWYSNDYLSTF